MNYLAPSMCEHDQDKEKLEPDRRHNEEIDRHQVRGVILQKRLPRRRGQLARSNAVLVYRRLRHFDAELAQLANNAWRAPQRIC